MSRRSFPAPSPRAAAATLVLALAGWGCFDRFPEVPRAECRLSGTPATTPAAPPASADPSSPCPPGMVLVPGGIDRSPRYVADGPFGGTLAEGGVAVPDLCFDVTEVTVDAFRACHAAGRCCEPDTGPFCNWGAADRSGHPVNCVDRRQAQQYCEFAGRHLPSTDEWVWAATGGARGWIWPWGDERVDDTRVCWKRRDFETGGGEGTCLPGSRPAGRSPEGIEDLSGNVKEWTSSPFASNPKGPDASVRGGAWENDPEHSNTRSRSEFRYDPDLRVAEVGFRCVAEPGTKPGS